jgi:hypothetical protein
MKKTSARAAHWVYDKTNVFYLTFVFVSFTSCASISTREATSEIRISREMMGAGLELSPLLLRVEPGQKVTNQTTYEIQINFESEEPIEEAPSLIQPFSAVRGRFDREGTYSYTLIYSSSKTFGRVTGTIVVGNPRQKERPLPRRPKEFLPPEETPDTLPDII